MKNQQVKVNLTPEMKAWLLACAAERQCSMSQIVIELLLAKMKAK